MARMTDWQRMMAENTRASADAGWAAASAATDTYWATVDHELNEQIRHEQTMAMARHMSGQLSDIEAAVDRNTAAQNQNAQAQAKRDFAMWRVTPEGQQYLAWEARAQEQLRLWNRRDDHLRQSIASAWEAARRTEPARPSRDELDRETEKPGGMGCLVMAGLALLAVVWAATALNGALEGKDLSGGHPLLQLLMTVVVFLLLPAALIALVVAVVGRLRSSGKARGSRARLEAARQAEAAWQRWYQSARQRIGAAPDEAVDWTEHATHRPYITRLRHAVVQGRVEHPAPDELLTVHRMPVRSSSQDDVVGRALAELRAGLVDSPSSR